MKTPGQIVKNKRVVLKMEKPVLAKKLGVLDSFIGHIERDGVPISERLIPLLQKHLKLEKSFPKLVAAHNIKVNAKLAKLRKARQSKKQMNTQPVAKSNAAVAPSTKTTVAKPKSKPIIETSDILLSSLNHQTPPLEQLFDNAITALTDRIKRDQEMIAKLDAMIRANGNGNGGAK